jgi:hypothetical protein
MKSIQSQFYATVYVRMRQQLTNFVAAMLFICDVNCVGHVAEADTCSLAVICCTLVAAMRTTVLNVESVFSRLL